MPVQRDDARDEHGREVTNFTILCDGPDCAVVIEISQSSERRDEQWSRLSFIQLAAEDDEPSDTPWFHSRMCLRRWVLEHVPEPMAAGEPVQS